jgi:hypothetical protein
VGEQGEALLRASSRVSWARRHEVIVERRGRVAPGCDACNAADHDDVLKQAVLAAGFARFSSIGIPAVNFGPDDPTKAHADDEFCLADDVVAHPNALLRLLS